MKYLLLPLLLTALHAKSQSFEVQELLLDIQKLSQEKQILNDLYTSYQTLEKGYSSIRDIAKGTFDLHKAFLDGLLTVSPAIKQYPKITTIITLQTNLLSSYHTAWNRFRSDPHLTLDEIAVLSNLYTATITRSSMLIEDLTTILTDNQLRASDGERINLIDNIETSMNQQWLRIRQLDNQTAWLSLQRASAQKETDQIKQLYNIWKK
ncbi:MAG: TerB family tellurite resistance protein [Bacteroidetes bacterium]|nr:TerB family tellurite resistance protein [Bacteroidota bacterium]